MTANTPLIEARGLQKWYDGDRVHALRGLDLSVGRGEVLAIMGPSGSGKSTLLQLLGALDEPSDGELLFDGKAIRGQRELASFRSRHIGFVFQSFYLIPTLTALQNVQVPMLGQIRSARERTARATQLLESVGLGKRLNHHPKEMSGGERQRVAVARSLANSPALLLADEPTGNLDSQNAKRILQVLLDVHDHFDTTLIIVTHDGSVASRADRVVHMLDGSCQEASAAEAATVQNV
ncbi:MAG: ABC transporter ATP-binding protein [Pseudomonadota bacterium]